MFARSLAATVAHALEAFAAGLRDGTVIGDHYSVTHLEGGGPDDVGMVELRLRFFAVEANVADEPQVLQVLRGGAASETCPKCKSDKIVDVMESTAGKAERLCIACNTVWAPDGARRGG